MKISEKLEINAILFPTARGKSRARSGDVRRLCHLPDGVKAEVGGLGVRDGREGTKLIGR